LEDTARDCAHVNSARNRWIDHYSGSVAVRQSVVGLTPSIAAVDGSEYADVGCSANRRCGVEVGWSLEIDRQELNIERSGRTGCCKSAAEGGPSGSTIQGLVNTLRSGRVDSGRRGRVDYQLLNSREGR